MAQNEDEICISIDDFDDEINIIGDNVGGNFSTKCPETRFKVIEEDEEETLLQSKITLVFG